MNIPDTVFFKNSVFHKCNFPKKPKKYEAHFLLDKLIETAGKLNISLESGFAK